MEDFLEELVKEMAIPGFRNAKSENWENAMNYIEKKITDLGHRVEIQNWTNDTGEIYKNFIVSIPGQEIKKYIIGAHYDTYENTPGADDNASAIAVMLGLLKKIKTDAKLKNPCEFVFYACEEPPFFGTNEMGSVKHASNTNKNEVECMICLEMVGYYSDKKESQSYPLPFMKWIYGSRGNYLLGVSNGKSGKNVQKTIKKLQQIRPTFYKKLLTPFVINGLDWSDHRSYWDIGVPALMLTDTAMFRNPNYHTEKDEFNTLDYKRMSNLVNDLFTLLENK